MRSKLLPYILIFGAATGLTGAGAYLLAPARVVSGVESSVPNQGNKDNNNDPADEDEDIFVPVELNARDHLINNLASMKTLSGHAEISLGYKEYNVNLNINELYLTLETLDNIEAYVNATIEMNGESTDIEVTYAQGTIYLSAFDTDIKLATSDFSRITDMLGSFDLPEMELPDSIANLDFDQLTNNLGSMHFEEIEGGYIYNFELFEGNYINFFSDEEYNFTGLTAENFTLEGLTLNLNAEVEATYEIVSKVAIPETPVRPYQKFADLIPLAEHIGKLAKQKQFGLELTANIKEETQEFGTDIEGAAQFDLDTKSGAAKLLVTEHEETYPWTHNVALDISEEDIIFNYNNSIKGKLAFSSIDSIMDLVNSIMADTGKEMNTSLEAIIELLDGTVVGDVLSGKYEALLRKNIIKDIVINDSLASVTIDKSVLGLGGDLTININFNSDRLIGVEIKNVCVKQLIGNFEIRLSNYSDSFSTGIDRNNLASYSDYANLVPLVKGVKNLLEQRQFAIGLTGSVKGEGEEKGLSLDGKVQIDFENNCGDGELDIVENETEWETAPKHNVKIGFDGTDFRFGYQDKLYGKFTAQSIEESIDSIQSLLAGEQDSALIKWISGMLSNAEETVISRITNGEYALLFHDMIKNITVTENYLEVTINGKLINLDGTITARIGFEGEQIKSVSLVNLEVFGFTIDVTLNMLEWDEDMNRLPKTDEGTVKYYDFTECNILVKFGIDTIGLDYFDISGTASGDMGAIGIDLTGLVSDMKNMPVTAKVYATDDGISVEAHIKNIPTSALLNGTNWLDYNSKILDIYYSNGEFFLTRREGKNQNTISNLKTTAEDFSDHIIDYLLGWGMGLNRSSLIWDKITGALNEPNPRTQAMDYASLLNNYAFTSYTGDEAKLGNYRWDIDINIAELANNQDLKKLTASIYSRDYSFTDPVTNEIVNKIYLSHLSAEFGLNLSNGAFVMNMGAELDVNNPDPYLTCDKFDSDERIKDIWSAFNQHLVDHANDSPLTF